MEIKQAFVGGKLMDVVSQDEYVRRVSMDEPELVQNTCIQANGTLYPVIRHPDNRTTPYAIYGDIAIKYGYYRFCSEWNCQSANFYYWIYKNARYTKIV